MGAPPHPRTNVKPAPDCAIGRAFARPVGSIQATGLSWFETRGVAALVTMTTLPCGERHTDDGEFSSPALRRRAVKVLRSQALPFCAWGCFRTFCFWPLPRDPMARRYGCGPSIAAHAPNENGRVFRPGHSKFQFAQSGFRPRPLSSPRLPARLRRSSSRWPSSAAAPFATARGPWP